MMSTTPRSNSLNDLKVSMNIDPEMLSCRVTDFHTQS